MVGFWALIVTLRASRSVKSTKLRYETAAISIASGTTLRATGPPRLPRRATAERWGASPMCGAGAGGDDGSWQLGREPAAGTRSAPCDTLLLGHECQRQAPACWPATLQPRWGAPGDDQVE